MWQPWLHTEGRIFMTNIPSAFQEGKAFIPYITAGYPDLESSRRYIKKMAESGADLIEIGIPFSDPSAEGPVIQDAIYHALKAGVTTDDIFDMIEQVREEVTIPLAIMTYANICYGYGLEAFMARCQQAGVAGLILPDVPFEEKDEFQEAAQSHDLSLISMVAPTSEERIAKIASEAEGFIYLVSSLGVTGTRSDISTDISSMVAAIRQVNPDLPIAVGFGISRPDQAREMAQEADGVIVGSAIIQEINQYPDQAEDALGQLVEKMKRAIL